MSKPVATWIEVYKAKDDAYRLRMTDGKGQVVPTRIGHVVGVRPGRVTKQLDAAIDSALSWAGALQQN